MWLLMDRKENDESFALKNEEEQDEKMTKIENKTSNE